MPDNIDTRNLDATSGAVYFAVGRGTEGGPASYHLSIAGITRGTREPDWGEVSSVAQNSGYSLGAIQVDFGQRGTWPVGAIGDRPLAAGEKTYVDAVIDQAQAYAKTHDLPFTNDRADLRGDLLSHGNGLSGRSSIRFMDEQTRDSINAWAGSDEGKQWIHANIDYPQVRNATQTAMSILDAHGSHIPDERRFEAISLLAKTANQMPGQLSKLEKVLENGGDYDALRTRAGEIRATHTYYDGPKAADIAARYEDAYANNKDAMDRAHAKVSSRDYAPAGERNDADIRVALDQIHPPRQQSAASSVLKEGASGKEVGKLESNLAVLGYTAANGQALNADKRFDGDTRAAVEAFQRAHGLEPVDGKAGPATLGAIDREARQLQTALAAQGHTDANGRALSVDGHLGAGSRAALGAYQQAHGLDPSGVLDAQTREAMAAPARTQAPADIAPALDPAQRDGAALRPLTDPGNAQHVLYMETLMRVHEAEEARGIGHGPHSERLAGALTVEAARAGLHTIDRVELNQDGSMARAVQANALRDEAALNRTSAPVQTADAMGQSLEESTARAQQAGDQQREQRLMDQQAQQHGARAMSA